MTTAKPSSLSSTLGRQRLIQYFFFGMFLLLLWQVLQILRPFYTALFGAAVLALLTYPLQAGILRRMPNHRNAAAACSTTLVVLIVVIPLMLFGWLFIKRTSRLHAKVHQLIGGARDFRERPLSAELPPAMAPLMETVNDIGETLNIDPKEVLLSSSEELSKSMTGMATHLIRNLALVVINLGVLVFILFFFLRDGPQMIRRLVELIPMADEHKWAILDRLQITLTAVIRGIFIVALVQGALAALGYALFDVAFPVQLGVLTVLLAPIPIVGSVGVWGLVVAGLAINADYQKAVHIFLWNAGIVSIIDHFLRPILISAEAKLPMLLLFFGMLGGLHAYGFTGLFLGPVVIALLMAFINIYRREYRWLLSAPSKEN